MKQFTKWLEYAIGARVLTLGLVMAFSVTPFSLLSAAPLCDANIIAGSFMQKDISSSGIAGQKIINLAANGNVLVIEAAMITKNASTGANTPFMGTWTCTGPNKIVITAFSYYSQQSVNNKQQLNPTFRTTVQMNFSSADFPVLEKWVVIALNPDPNIDYPLDPNAGTVAFVPATPKTFERIKALPSDFARAGI